MVLLFIFFRGYYSGHDGLRGAFDEVRIEFKDKTRQPMSSFRLVRLFDNAILLVDGQKTALIDRSEIALLSRKQMQYTYRGLLNFWR
jgi:hypothetical protein